MKSIKAWLVLGLAAASSIAFAETPCKSTQTAKSFRENFFNANPSWICPGGKLIIDLGGQSHKEITQWIRLSADKKADGAINLTFEKFDPAPKQAYFKGQTHAVDTVSISASPGTVNLPTLVTGNLSDGGAKRTLTITNNSSYNICLWGNGGTCK